MKLKCSVRGILATFAVLGVAVSTACSSTTTTTLPPSTTTTSTTSTISGTPLSVNLDLVARGFAFEKTALSVPAGATVTLNFSNQDNVPHNFAAYTNSSATKSIFVGQVISSPATVAYKFTAPSTPGTYFFRCDLHPSMTGSFTVTP